MKQGKVLVEGTSHEQGEALTTLCDTILTLQKLKKLCHKNLIEADIKNRLPQVLSFFEGMLRRIFFIDVSTNSDRERKICKYLNFM